MADKKTPDDRYPTPQQQGQTPAQQSSGTQQADVAELIRKLGLAGGIPVSLSLTPLPKIDTALRLNFQPRQTVAFPPCANELLALVNTVTDTHEFIGFFKEYFKFLPHPIFGQQKGKDGSGHDILEELVTLVGASLDPALVDCVTDDGFVVEKRASHPARQEQVYPSWPSECCICTPCVTLDGNRNPPPISPLPTTPSIRRLFLGDVMWLFYFERMGVHQILGAILDAFAYNGRLPISNGKLQAGVRDDIVALVLEVMVRQTKMGMSSTMRDRSALYRTSLGWSLPGAKDLNLDTEVNRGLSALFHKFIYLALEFYRDKRLAVAIQGAASTGVGQPSVATLITIRDTLDVLKRRFEAFDYGRNYYNCLSGIVWTIAGLTVVKELAGTLGIPDALRDGHELIPAAYDLLVLKRPPTGGDANRFLLHRDCARNGRDILLDLEVIDHTKAELGEELDQWLSQVEAKVEGYRTAYRALTGVDLGASATPTIEQQV
jgi:hypothetical protein